MGNMVRSAMRHLGRVALLLVVVFSLAAPCSAGTRSTVELSGDILQILLPVTAGGMSLYRGDWQGVSQFSTSFLTTMGLTYGLKYSINAERPYGGGLSFPSGHTSASFSSAAFIQKRYGWEFGLPAYAAAAFVGWSRVESDNHHLRDVLAGAALGILSSYIFADRYQEDVVVTPHVGEGVYGLLLRCKF